MTAFSGQPVTLDPLPSKRRVVVRSTVRSDAFKTSLETRAPELAIESCLSHDDVRSQVQGPEPVDLIVWRANDGAADPLEELPASFGSSTNPPIVLMVDRYDAALVSRAMARGVTALVGRTMSADMVLCVLRLVLAGGTYFPCEPAWFAPAVAPEIAPTQGLRRGALGLTPRQLDVLGYICQGMSNKIIARALGMRETTVKAHVMQIMRRLNAENRTQVALRVSQMGFLGPASAKN